MRHIAKQVYDKKCMESTVLPPKEQIMVEPLETIESAAKILSLSPWTIRLYVRQGKIRPVRIGRRIAIEQAEIRRLIEEGRDDSSWDRGGRR